MLAKLLAAVVKIGYFPVFLMGAFIVNGIGDLFALAVDAPFRMGLAFLLCTSFVVSVDHSETLPHASLAMIVGTVFESVFLTNHVQTAAVEKIVATTAIYIGLTLVTHFVFAPFVRRMQEEHPVGGKAKEKPVNYRSELY